MSTFSVSPVRVSALTPIPGADKIEAATVAGYQVVVGKGSWAVGDWALYIPEAAILPDELIETMGLTGRLSGRAKNRVKAIRLRGCLSQGLLHDFIHDDDPDPTDDYAERLGITKWRPVVPARFAGDMLPAPDIMRWCEVENIRKLRYFNAAGGTWFDPFDGLTVDVTEKVHGTCFISTMTRDGNAMVSSKGVAGRSLSLVESADNVYWRAYHEHNIAPVLADLLAAFPNSRTVSLYGEVYGAGIQDLAYGVPGGSFAAFDARVDNDWLPRWALEESCQGRCDVVPLLYTGPYDHDAVWAMASGPSVAGRPGAHIREGAVVRPVPERSHGGNRLIAKFVSSEYLLRSGGSEFE